MHVNLDLQIFWQYFIQLKSESLCMLVAIIVKRWCKRYAVFWILNSVTQWNNFGQTLPTPHEKRSFRTFNLTFVFFGIVSFMNSAQLFPLPQWVALTCLTTKIQHTKPSKVVFWKIETFLQLFFRLNTHTATKGLLKVLIHVILQMSMCDERYTSWRFNKKFNVPIQF